MKLNCKRIDFTYTPGEEIFTFPEESGLSFLFDVDEELTDNPAAMDTVGETVSYTHLDVYKRQLLYCAPKVAFQEQRKKQMYG